MKLETEREQLFLVIGILIGVGVTLASLMAAVFAFSNFTPGA